MRVEPRQSDSRTTGLHSLPANPSSRVLALPTARMNGNCEIALPSFSLAAPRALAFGPGTWLAVVSSPRSGPHMGTRAGECSPPRKPLSHRTVFSDQHASRLARVSAQVEEVQRTQVVDDLRSGRNGCCASAGGNGPGHRDGDGRGLSPHPRRRGFPYASGWPSQSGGGPSPGPRCASEALVSRRSHRVEGVEFTFKPEPPAAAQSRLREAKRSIQQPSIQRRVGNPVAPAHRCRVEFTPRLGDPVHRAIRFTRRPPIQSTRITHNLACCCVDSPIFLAFLQHGNSYQRQVSTRHDFDAPHDRVGAGHGAPIALRNFEQGSRAPASAQDAQLAQPHARARECPECSEW